MICHSEFYIVELYNFQFHQGLSHNTELPGLRERFITFNSIKDYLEKEKISEIKVENFQFHQGLSNFRKLTRFGVKF